MINFFIKLGLIFLVAYNASANSLSVTPPAFPSRSIQSGLLPLKVELFANINKNRLALHMEPITNGGAIHVKKDGELIFMDRTGQFWEIKKNIVAKLHLNAPNNYSVFLKENPGAFGNGLLMRATSFVYDEENRLLYVAFNRYESKNKMRFCVSVVNLDLDNLGVEHIAEKKWSSVFQADFTLDDYVSNGSGGKLAIHNQKIYLTLGFADSDDILYDNNKSFFLPQSKSSQQGKILEIDYLNRAWRIYSIGHRNPEGLFWTQGGILFETEHGPQGGDEVNIIRYGNNYGWPLKTFGTRYGTYDYDWPQSVTNSKAKFTLPMYAFMPSVGISSILQLQGFDDKFDGDLLIGSLKAQSIFRLKLSGNHVLYSEQIWLGRRVRDLAQFQNDVYILTDDSLILKITVNEVELKQNKKRNDLYFTSEVIKNKCLLCHSFTESNKSSLAPSLAHLIGRKLGSDNFINYSNGFKKSNLYWNEKNLRQFLKNPQDFINGSLMPNQDLDEKQIDEVVKILLQY